MVRTVAEKPQYTFNKGYITEQSPVAVAEGSALDMENFEIDVTGGLRRRRAIAVESGGNDLELSEVARSGNEAFARYVWRNAGGVATRTVHVVQVGQYLNFIEENETLGATEPLVRLDLSAFRTPSATASQVRSNLCSFADGRSHLFVAQEFINPFYVVLSGDSITVVLINIRIRDFVGIQDGVSNTTKPATLLTAHRYNLYNRGWTTSEIDQYFDDTAKYPSKNMISSLGYKRVVDPGTQEGYGTKAWDTDKLEAEIFKDVSAPQGSLLLNPFDTTVAYGNVDPSSGVSSNIPISTWSFTSGSPTIVTITTDTAHGLTTGDSVTIDNNLYRYIYWLVPVERSLDGSYEVEVTGTSTFRIQVPEELFQNFNGWSNQFLSKGTVGVDIAEGGGNIITADGGYITDKRPTVVAWYAGRIWYFGTPYDRLVDTAMFTPIIEGTNQYGLCYQANDPTSEILNALTPSDGGTIRIAGLHGVKSATVLGGSLIVCAQSGIWEIRGGGNAGFTADNYLVRKISDAECVSPAGAARTDNAICVATKRGLYLVGYDTNSGLISAQNITVSRVNTYWNSIPDEKLATIRLDYDDAKKRLYTLISKDTTHTIAKSYSVPSNVYTEALVMDFRIGEGGAFYKLSMPLQLSGEHAGYIGGIVTLDGADNSDRNRKVKYAYMRTATGSERETVFCDTDNDGYTDVSNEEDVPFFRASYDNTGDWHKRKRATYCVYMFMNRTETGYTEIDDEQVPTNPGSVILQGRWDWSDSSNSGKWSNPMQAYRPRGMYNMWSSEEGMQNGYPVVVTKNKIRGSGRSLALHIRGEAGKDCSVLGWLIQYGAA